MDTLNRQQTVDRVLEAALVERARSGNADAFAELVGGCYPRLLRSALRILNNAADAEDAVQEALLSAFLHLGDFRREAAFSTWLVRITVNRALAVLRGRRVEALRLEDVRSRRPCTERDAWPLERTTPERICLSKEADRLLRESIGRLRPRQRAVLALRDLEGLGNQDIAMRLRLSENAVKTRVHRGRRNLQKLLTNIYGMNSDAVSSQLEGASRSSTRPAEEKAA